MTTKELQINGDPFFSVFAVCQTCLAVQKINRKLRGQCEMSQKCFVRGSRHVESKTRGNGKSTSLFFLFFFDILDREMCGNVHGAMAFSLMLRFSKMNVVSLIFLKRKKVFWSIKDFLYFFTVRPQPG